MEILKFWLILKKKQKLHGSEQVFFFFITIILDA